jgi:hypothetical protein
MARCHPGARSRGQFGRPGARVFSVLSEFVTNRFEELNNYSGRMTTQIEVIAAGFAERSLDPLQNGLVPNLTAGRVEMDAIERVPFRHGQERSE